MAGARLRHRRHGSGAYDRRPAWPVRRPARVRPGADPRRASPAGDVRRPARGVASRPRRPGARVRAPTEPAGAPARVAALARRRGGGAATMVHRRAAPSARSLRDRQPRADARRSRRRATGCSSPSSAPRSRAPRSSPSSTAGSRMPTSSSATSSREFREVLDRLAIALEGRDPVVADLAREVRFRYFDEPVIAEARERVYAKMEQHVAALTSEPERPDAEAADQGDRRLPPSARAAIDGRDGLGITGRSPAARRGDGPPLLPDALARRIRAPEAGRTRRGARRLRVRRTATAAGHGVRRAR